MASLTELNRIVLATDLHEWLVTIEATNDAGQVVPVTALVTANSKSEARARVKKAFKGKFPPRTTITKTGRSPRQALMNATVEALAVRLQEQIKARLDEQQSSSPAVVSPGNAEAGGLDVHGDDVGADVPAVAAGV